MATGISTSLGSVLIHGYTAAGVFYEPYLTETYDVSTNKSTLSIAHRIRIMEEWGGRYDIPDSTPIYVTIDGTTTTHTFSSMPSVYPTNQAVTVQTTTHTVTHNSDGTKTITISCRWNNSSAQYQGATSSKTVTLTTIPRASSMSFSTSQTMGTAYTFTISRASSSFKHTITWSFGGSSGTAVSSTSSTTPSFTPATATFAPKCTNATSGTITYTLNTYSGSTLIGSKSYTATLSIPSSAASTMSFTTSQTMGNSYTFSINRASSSFWHTVIWSFGGSSGTAVSYTSYTTRSFTPAIETFAPKCINATSATITYTLNTYNGSAFVGSKSYTATLAVPSSVVPSVSLAVSAVNQFNSLYLQGKSSVKLTATGSVSSDHGATIRSYSFQVLNSASTAVSSGSSSTSSTSATHTSGVLSGSGTHTCKVTITDSRGRTATATKTITVTAYSKPVWGNVSVYRCDANGDNQEDGTYIALTAMVSYSAISGNSLTLTYQYKASTASSYSTATAFNNGEKTVFGGTFSEEVFYNIKLRAVDTVGNPITNDLTVSSSAVGIDYDPVNNTLGLLRYAPSSSSDSVYMPKGYAFGPDGGTFSKLITRADIGSGTSNDLLFTIPHLSYSTIGASNTFDASVAQKWLKYVTTNYGSKLGTDRIVVNELTAGVSHVIIGSAYDWTDVVDGMPRYCWFRVYSYRFENYTFGATSGSFVMTSQRFDQMLKTTWFSKTFTVSANSTTTMKASDYITIPSGYTCLGVTAWSTNCVGVVPRSIRPFTGNYDFELQNTTSSSRSGTWQVLLLFVRTMFT